MAGRTMDIPVRTITGLVIVLLVGFQSPTPTCSEPPEAGPSALSSGPLDWAGLHNVYRITDNLFSGSSPEGDAGFRSLKEMGIKTVITVDGVRPDVEHAKKYGLRYVHLPFGYDGISRQRILELAKA